MSDNSTQQVSLPQEVPPQGDDPQPPCSQQTGAPEPPQAAQQARPAAAEAGFEPGALWRNMGPSGQAAAISGLVLFISFFLPWFAVTGTCSGPLCGSVTYQAYRYDAFALISSVAPPNASESYGFFLMVFVLLASLLLMALPILGALGRLPGGQARFFLLLAVGVALLVEGLYLLTAFGAFPNETGSQSFEGTTVRVSAGPSFGFALGALATLAAGGVSLYFAYIKKPAYKTQGCEPIH